MRPSLIAPLAVLLAAGAAHAQAPAAAPAAPPAPALTADGPNVTREQAMQVVNAASAEAELDRMQADLRTALNSRARLAALGEAVAKINHDLKNMLTSAQIASERLAALKDPKVSQALPRLEGRWTGR